MDPLTNRHKDTKADTGAIIHSTFEGWGRGYTMWVSYSGEKKKTVPQFPTFPCTDTRVYNQRGTLIILCRSVWPCHYPNLLHKHTWVHIHKNTQLQQHTHTHTHKIRSACASRATKASLPQGGDGNCVFSGEQLD